MDRVSHLGAVYPALRLAPDGRDNRRAPLSPCVPGVFTIERSSAATGRDGAIRLPRADGRRLEGRRDGPSSRRLAPTSSGRRASDGDGAAARPRGSRPWRGPARGGAEAKEWCGTQDAANAGAERQPVRGGQPPPWLRSRHPRARRTSPAPPAGLLALAADARGMPIRLRWPDRDAPLEWAEGRCLRPI